jgi:hypothetical protein
MQLVETRARAAAKTAARADFLAIRIFIDL